MDFALARGWGGPWGGGVSVVEILILCELRAGERLELEKAVSWYRRPGRHFPVSAVPFGPGTDIWRSCRFPEGRFFALCVLCLVGLAGSSLATLVQHHCQLRHIGWEKCGHGLTSRPRETASEEFLEELPVLLRYPPRSAAALLGCTLPLRYCAGRFARRIPTWRLPVDGHVIGLVSDDCGGYGRSALVAAPGSRGSAGLVVLAEVLNESDWTEKLQHTLSDMVFWEFSLGQGFGRD